jgi:hypothetical protein
MNKIVGRCSICGGNVTLPDVWMGIHPPVPTCQSCGATKKSDLPVIPMTPPRRWPGPDRASFEIKSNDRFKDLWMQAFGDNLSC